MDSGHRCWLRSRTLYGRPYSSPPVSTKIIEMNPRQKDSNSGSVKVRSTFQTVSYISYYPHIINRNGVWFARSRTLHNGAAVIAGVRKKYRKMRCVSCELVLGLNCSAKLLGFCHVKQRRWHLGFLLITWNQSDFANWHAISRLLSAPSSWRCSTLATRDGICLKAPNEQSSLHQAFKTWNPNCGCSPMQSLDSILNLLTF